MKNLYYFIVRIFIHVKYFSKWRHIKLGHNFHVPSSLRLFVNKQSSIVIGNNFLGRRNIELRACGGCITLGNNVFINSNVYIASMKSIAIGNDCLIGPNVVIVDQDHDYKKNKKDFILEEVTIEDNVWIGANCVILKGTKIGQGTVIGAGSIVKGDIPSHSLVHAQKASILVK